jgi:hypothetical protein
MTEEKKAPKKMTKAQLAKDVKVLKEIAERFKGEEFRVARKGMIIAVNNVPVLK